MNLKHYDKDVQGVAFKWWRSLSINEMKALEQKHSAICISGHGILRSEIARIHEIHLTNP